jgi:hypothetical protein
MPRPSQDDPNDDERDREKQIVLLGAGLLCMGAFVALPVIVVMMAVSKTVSFEAVAIGAGALTTAIFCLALMSRVQHEDWRRSIFAGPRGRRVAVLGMALLGLMLAGCAWSVVSDESDREIAGQMARGAPVVLAGLLHLGRRFRQSLRGELE